MKVTEIQVKGFRSLNDVTWTPGDLNVIIGPNASGKSNLLKLLDLLSVSAAGNLVDHVQREGGMQSLVWDQQVQTIDVRLNSQWKFANDVENRFEYLLRIEQLGKSASYRIGKEVLNLAEAQDGRVVDEERSVLRRTRDTAFVYDPEADREIQAKSGLPEDETLLSAITGPFAVSGTVVGYRLLLEDWSIHQNLLTHRDSVVRQAVVARMEKRVDADGSNLVTVLHTLYSSDREFKQTLDAAMRAAFGDDYDELVFPPAADQRVQLRVRWRSLRQETSAADLSDGTLRFLFILAVLANPEPATLIAIDEPELGLHPGMLPIVAEHAQDAAQRRQVVFTTHSPEFLDAFGENPPTTTVATWDEGKTHLKILSEDALRYWTKEYSLGRLFRSGELEAMG